MPICRQSGKHVHLTNSDAIDHLIDIKKTDPSYSGRVYYCPYCRYFHVGRKKQGKERYTKPMPPRYLYP